ncbi:MAG TPA: hypothetical protein ENH19_01065 [Actinobacteria bacterium]|nr:hypothetical protein [Actinomycetes bacterium]HEX21228.1 hypothetical protein [Actinomycetota bacterium]
MKKTFLLIAAALLVMVLFLTGCGATENNSLQEKVNKNKSVNKIKPVDRSKAKKTEALKPTETTAGLSLNLYFANAASDKLVKEQHKVAATTETAKASIEQLINGPTGANHYATIPKGSKLLGIFIQDKIATVNFSKEFIDNHPGGSSAEILTIFSIVDTLTEYPSINSVRFQVEGRNIASIAGHYDLSMPVKRDSSLIATQ